MKKRILLLCLLILALPCAALGETVVCQGGGTALSASIVEQDGAYAFVIAEDGGATVTRYDHLLDLGLDVQNMRVEAALPGEMWTHPTVTLTLDEQPDGTTDYLRFCQVKGQWLLETAHCSFGGRRYAMDAYEGQLFAS